MLKNATSWFQEDKSWRKTTRHGDVCQEVSTSGKKIKQKGRGSDDRENGLLRKKRAKQIGINEDIEKLLAVFAKYCSK
jgi:hypothetical protein